MASMTRSRATEDGRGTELTAEYCRSRVVTLCRKSLRQSVMRAQMRATRRRALSRFTLPGALRDRSRCALASLRRSRRSCRGSTIFFPVDSAARAAIPASTPTADPAGAGGRIFSSTRMDTNQRPALSRDSVTVDGSAPSGKGRDQTMSSGPSILARNSRPLRQRNAERVYSADARDLSLLLKAG